MPQRLNPTWTLLSSLRTVSADQLHSLALKLGLSHHPPIATALLKSYSSLQRPSAVLQLFADSPTKDFIIWNALVSALCRNGLHSEAVSAFRGMLRSGFEPTDVSFVGVVPACANCGAMRLGKELHGFSLKREIGFKTNVLNSIVDFYTKLGDLDAAVAVFEWIVEKDLVSWNNVICGCTNGGSPRQAIDFFLEMRGLGIRPGVTVIRSVLSTCSLVQDGVLGSSLHGYVVKIGLLGLLSVGTVIVRMYAELGEVEMAGELFDRMRCKDFVAWSAMVSVYAQKGHAVLALETFRRMRWEGWNGNEVTFVSLLQACSAIGEQELGKRIHAHVIRSGYSTNLFLTSALIDFYCKLGMLCEGKTLFGTIRFKDMVCWSSMINGFGMNGHGEEAMKTFHNMLEERMEPNEVIFVSLLSACSHCGLEDEGWKWFGSMKESYGVRPSLAHYSCMVDMLCRRGKLEEAVKLISQMPMEPDAGIWGALLAGCRVAYGDTEAADIAGEQLLKLDPRNGSYHIALSNMYANLGKWDDVERIRQLVHDKGLEKEAGRSVI